MKDKKFGNIACKHCKHGYWRGILFDCCAHPDVPKFEVFDPENGGVKIKRDWNIHYTNEWNGEGKCQRFEKRTKEDD